MVIWAIWAWHQRHTWTARFSAAVHQHRTCSPYVQWSGDSVVNNSQFDLTIGLGLAYDGAATLAAARTWSVGAVRAVIIRVERDQRGFDPTGCHEPQRDDRNYRALVSDHAAVARAEAARVAAIPGRVGCNIKLVCRMAGKAFVFDDFKSEQLLKIASLTPDHLSDLLSERGIVVVAIDNRAGADSVRRDLLSR